MAEGDICSGSVTLIDGSYTLITPSVSGQEWIIHNIYIPQGSAVDIYHYNNNGSIREIKIFSTTQSLCGYFFHCNEDNCIKVVNNSGFTIYVGYDGILTSE